MGHISREAVVVCGLFIGMATSPHEARVDVLLVLTCSHLSGQTTRRIADR
jgi:hypothetical protein